MKSKIINTTMAATLGFLTFSCGMEENNADLSIHKGVSSSENDIRRILVNGSSCTATFISPKTLITAAHCIDHTSVVGSKGPYVRQRSGNVRVYALNSNVTEYTASTIYEFSSYSGSWKTSKVPYDLAAIVLSGNQRFRGTPRKIGRVSPTMGDVFKDVAIFGYAGQQNQKFAGINMKGNNHFFVSDQKCVGGRYLESGDSGGPSIYQGKIVAINSGGGRTKNYINSDRCSSYLTPINLSFLYAAAPEVRPDISSGNSVGFKSRRRGYYFNMWDARGNVEGTTNHITTPNSDSVFVIEKVGGAGRLYSGDAIAIKARRTGYYFNMWDSRGNLEGTTNHITTPNSDSVFVIEKVHGSGAINNGDAVAIKSRRLGYYFNMFDATGNVEGTTNHITPPNSDSVFIIANW